LYFSWLERRDPGAPHVTCLPPSNQYSAHGSQTEVLHWAWGWAGQVFPAKQGGTIPQFLGFGLQLTGHGNSHFFFGSLSTIFVE